MNATIQFVDNMRFMGVAESGHAVLLDTSQKNGGNASAPSPMEMVLFALGTCSGMDVVSILRKKRIPIEHFSIEAAGTRRDEHPRIFTDIRLTYKFRGPNLAANRKALEDTVRLSQEKFCSVAGMLAATVKLTWQVEILESTDTAG
ncbi:MAG TPA: OsmC family protein [Firmicutes bacterium]|jgi:putative redox protein|nr:OsmC family protein [Bacillota bacterium]